MKPQVGCVAAGGGGSGRVQPGGPIWGDAAAHRGAWIGRCGSQATSQPCATEEAGPGESAAWWP
jgi:hypothetical protein